jgi:SNF2 family DNA or RNA helicase
LDELIILLKLIACSLYCFQAQNKCVYEILIPTLFSLKFRLENLKDKNLKYCAFLITPLISSLTNWFNLFFKLPPEINEAILATFFQPNFKLRWIPDYIIDHKKKKKIIIIQNLCINGTQKLINGFSNHECSKDSEESFFIFSSQVKNKQQLKNEFD